MRQKLIYPFLITFCLFAPDLAAQWQAYTPALPDTAGTFDLRIADGNDQVAWGISMKYDVLSNGYYWVAMDSLIYTKTTDGGETWPAVNSTAVYYLSFADELHGLAFDYATAAPSYTSDGGATWAALPAISGAKEPSEFIILLHDAQGRLLARQTLDKTSTGNAQFDMSGLAAGVYTVMVSSKGGYLTRRVVKG